MDNYLAKNNITATLIRTKDTYYGEKAVKAVSLNCTQPSSPFPCEIVLMIDEKGDILEEFHTA